MDGKESSQTIARRDVKKLLLEALAADLGKVTEAGRVQLTKDQIMALAAGIVEMEAKDKRWHDRTYHIKAQIAAAPGELMKRMDALRKDQEKAKELERLRMRSDDLLRESERLRKEFVAATAKKRISVRAAYDKQIKEIRAVDWYERGLVDINLGKYDQTLHDFDIVIGLEPNKTRAYVYRGLANYNLGKYDQAIEDYDKVTKLDPKEAKAYYNLARIYSLKDNHEKALHDLDAAIKIDQGFKGMAKKENDFDRIRELPEFIKLIDP